MRKRFGEAIAVNPQVRIPKMMSEWNELRATYRLMWVGYDVILIHQSIAQTHEKQRES
ncbi:MAG: hypothetical protein PUP91_22000 [Rhizonema sp. PD37]|nr:hypothetical protein [Rhizonema sp. PD37]